MLYLWCYKDVRVKTVKSMRDRHHKNYQVELSVEPFRIYRNEVNIETKKNKNSHSINGIF